MGTRKYPEIDSAALGVLDELQRGGVHAVAQVGAWGRRQTRGRDVPRILYRRLRPGSFPGWYADHNQTLVFVFLRPAFHVGQRAQAIDAGVGPEIDQHDLAA
jgi:hypothetical protein